MNFKVTHFPGYKVWTAGIYMIRRGGLRRHGGYYAAYARRRDGHWEEIIRPEAGDLYRRTLEGAKSACRIHAAVLAGLRSPERAVVVHPEAYHGVGGA